MYLNVLFVLLNASCYPADCHLSKKEMDKYLHK